MTLAPPPASPIDIASRPDPGDFWPTPVFAIFARIAMCWFAVMILIFLAGLAQFPKNVMIGVFIAILVIILVASVYAISFSIRRKQRRKTATGPTSDPAHRVRVVGLPDEIAGLPLDSSLADTSFEPAIYRSIFQGVQFVVMENGQPKVHKRPKKHIQTLPRRSTAAKWSMILSALAAVALVAAVQYITFHSLKFLSAPQAWSVMAATVLFDSLVNPVYIRIAPGVLDILRYGPMGIGPVKFDRYDLRTAKIVIDMQKRAFRVDDRSRPDFPIVYISQYGLFSGQLACRDALLAATTTAQTPPLPTDELVG